MEGSRGGQGGDCPRAVCTRRVCCGTLLLALLEASLCLPVAGRSRLWSLGTHRSCPRCGLWYALSYGIITVTTELVSSAGQGNRNPTWRLLAGGGGASSAVSFPLVCLFSWEAWSPEGPPFIWPHFPLGERVPERVWPGQDAGGEEMGKWGPGFAGQKEWKCNESTDLDWVPRGLWRARPLRAGGLGRRRTKGWRAWGSGLSGAGGEFSGVL